MWKYKPGWINCKSFLLWSLCQGTFVNLEKLHFGLKCPPLSLLFVWCCTCATQVNLSMYLHFGKWKHFCWKSHKTSTKKSNYLTSVKENGKKQFFFDVVGWFMTIWVKSSISFVVDNANHAIKKSKNLFFYALVFTTVLQCGSLPLKSIKMYRIAGRKLDSKPFLVTELSKTANTKIWLLLFFGFYCNHLITHCSSLSPLWKYQKKKKHTKAVFSS